MHFTNRHRADRFFAPNTDGEGGGAVPPEEIEAPEEDLVTPPEEDAEPPEEVTPPDPLDELREKLTALETRNQELEAKVTEATKPVPPPDSSVKVAPEMPDFAQEAANEAAQYQGLTEIVDGQAYLTDAGEKWVKSRELVLAARWQKDQDSAAEFDTSLESAKPEMVTATVTGLRAEYDFVPEEEAGQIAKDYVTIRAGYGRRAFEGPDAEKLTTTAYLLALGAQKKRELDARKKGAVAPEEEEEPKDALKKHAPVTGGAVRTNGNVVAKAYQDADSASFLNEWEKSHGRKPNASEVAAFAKKGLVKI